MLNEQVERTIRIELERIAVANGEAMKRVGYKISLFVVQGNRPEGANRRYLLFRKMQHVPFGSGQRLARGVFTATKIYGVFGRISAQQAAGRQCPGSVISPVTTCLC